MSVPIPGVVWQRIRQFVEAGKTGSIVLDVKQGRILAYKVVECGRVNELPPSDPAPVERA